MTKKPETVEDWNTKGKELICLLIECRDAISCITRTQARLRNIDLSLADRVDKALEPWEVPNDTLGAI